MNAYAYGPPSFRQEVTFFVGNGVQVTSSRFVVHGQMYPLAGITSVAPFTVPASRAGMIAWATFFGLLALCSLPSLPSGGAVFTFLLFGAITALFIWRATARKDQHGVFISTAGMQMRALSSENLAFVQQVVGALHQAIASR